MSSVIKSARLLFPKIIVAIHFLIFINYFRYTYAGAGFSMSYGLASTISFSISVIPWVLRVKNPWHIPVGHFLPLGVQGVLKVLTPPIEIPGVLIRPTTLATRLATNTSRGHAVLPTFRYSIISGNLLLSPNAGVPLLFPSLIEFLVCVIQAYAPWSLLFTYLIDTEAQQVPNVRLASLSFLNSHKRLIHTKKNPSLSNQIRAILMLQILYFNTADYVLNPSFKDLIKN